MYVINFDITPVKDGLFLVLGSVFGRWGKSVFTQAFWVTVSHEVELDAVLEPRLQPRKDPGEAPSRIKRGVHYSIPVPAEASFGDADKGRTVSCLLYTSDAADE